jgi:hypothetical protein
MRKAVLAFIAATMMFSVASAEEGKKKFSEKQLAQHQVMRDCNASAKSQGLKGADRKAFMKSCLSGDVTPSTSAAAPAAAAPAEIDKKAAQKDKMKACNATAKEQGLKGEARKTFMSTCLAAS